jgi:SAM-dependent methyltransferase
LSELGYRARGIDPDPALLDFARVACPNVQFLQGQLPELPIEPESCHLIGVFNVWRPLHLLGETHVFDGIARYLAPGGTIAVIENIRPGHSKYVDEKTLAAWAVGEQLELALRLPFRVGRRWYLYLMMLGLYPRWALDSTADREIRTTERRQYAPRFTYRNVLFLFRKPARR